MAWDAHRKVAVEEGYPVPPSRKVGGWQELWEEILLPGPT